MFYLYKITHKQSNKSYIGVTRNIIARWNAHMSPNSQRDSLIANSISLANIHEFEFTVIEQQVDEFTALSREEELVIEFNTIFPHGYNQTIGGGAAPTLYGEDNGNTKLTEQDVLIIRDRYAAGETQVGLAKEYKVTRTNIGSIVRGETWKNVGGTITLGRRSSPKTKEGK